MNARKDPVVLILLIVQFLLLVFILQFGQVTGYSPAEHEGRVIDVVIAGVAKALQ